MKKILVLLFVVVTMLSCTAVTGDKEYRTIEIDGCEYLFKYNGYNSGESFTHKGNCKNPIHDCKIN